MKRVIFTIGLVLSMLCNCCSTAKTLSTTQTQQYQDHEKIRLRQLTSIATVLYLFESGTPLKTIYLHANKVPKITADTKIWADWLGLFSVDLKEFFVGATEVEDYNKEVDVIFKQGIMLGIESYVYNVKELTRDLREE